MTRTACFTTIKAAMLGSVALSGIGMGVVVASSTDDAVSPSDARASEISAQHAYAKHDYKHAIKYGEVAVAGDPRNADFRLALGQAELAAGRFSSAATLFGDVLTLDPSRSRAALNLALTQAALGNPSAGRATLEAHRDQLSAQDFGLAAALTGDTSEAIRVLEIAARSDAATSKVRQNLAFAYAMAGRWGEARTTAGQDLSPELVDQRMSDWAQISHPANAWEQVASVLHVTPANDAGLPYRLALKGDSNAAMAQLAPAAAPAPVAVAAAPYVAAASPAVASDTNDMAQTLPARYEVPATNTPAYVAPVPVRSEEATPARSELAAIGTPVIESIPAPMVRVAAPAHHILRPVRIAAAAPLIHAAHNPIKHFVVERPRIRVAAAHPVAVLHHAPPHQSHHAFSTGRYAVQIGAFPSVAMARICCTLAAWV